MKRFKFAIIVLALSVITGIGVISAQAPDDTLLLRAGGDITTFNPPFVVDAGSGAATGLIWPTLYETDPMTGLPVPGLTSWEISEDGLTYTFTMLEGVAWSDGTPMTAEDAVFTIGAYLSEELGSPQGGQLRASGATVELIDDLTFSVTFGEVSCTALQSMGGVRVLPAHRFEADYSDFTTNSINTDPDISGGPYILEEWRPDEFSRYSANPNYWAGEPQIPFVVYRVIEDNSVVIQALLAGELDYMVLPGNDLEQLEAAGVFQINPLTSNNAGFFAMNWANPDNPQAALDVDGNYVEQDVHPIFGDIMVRQAVSMGYDKDAIVASSPGATRIHTSINPAFDWATNPDLELRSYDPEAAMSMLDEAGWTMNADTGIRECNGCTTAEDGTPMAFELVYSDFFGYFETAAIVIEDQLSQLGMDVSLQRMEWGAYLSEAFLAQQFDATVISFGAGNDPGGIANTIMHSRNDQPGGGFNATSFSNPEFDDLADQANSIPGCAIEDRAPLYYRMQEIEYEQVAYDFFLSPTLYTVASPRIANFGAGPFGQIGSYWTELTLDN